MAALTMLTIWWFSNARHLFRGPVAQGSAQDLARIEAEIGAAAATETPARGRPA